MITILRPPLNQSLGYLNFKNYFARFATHCNRWATKTIFLLEPTCLALRTLQHSLAMD